MPVRAEEREGEVRSEVSEEFSDKALRWLKELWDGRPTGVFEMGSNLKFNKITPGAEWRSDKRRANRNRRFLRSHETVVICTQVVMEASSQVLSSHALVRICMQTQPWCICVGR